MSQPSLEHWQKVALAYNESFAAAHAGLEVAESARPWAVALLSWYDRHPDAAGRHGPIAAELADHVETLMVELMRSAATSLEQPVAEIDGDRLFLGNEVRGLQLREGQHLADPRRWAWTVGAVHAPRFGQLCELDFADPNASEAVRRAVGTLLLAAERVGYRYVDNVEKAAEVIRHRGRLRNNDRGTEAASTRLLPEHSSLADYRVWLGLAVPGPVEVISPLWHPHNPPGLPPVPAELPHPVKPDPPLGKSYPWDVSF